MNAPLTDLKVLFIAGFGPISTDDAASRSLYLETLGLPLTPMAGNESYLFTEAGTLDGVKHFAIWPLSQAAQSCFGTDTWPAELLRPQAWLELEVENVASATQVLQQQGYALLVADRLEPWGQQVSRFLGPEGLLLGITNTPWLR